MIPQLRRGRGKVDVSQKGNWSQARYFEELKRGLLLLKQIVWIPVFWVSKMKIHIKQSGGARGKKPFFLWNLGLISWREVISDGHHDIYLDPVACLLQWHLLFFGCRFETRSFVIILWRWKWWGGEPRWWEFACWWGPISQANRKIGTGRLEHCVKRCEMQQKKVMHKSGCIGCLMNPYDS